VLVSSTPLSHLTPHRRTPSPTGPYPPKPRTPPARPPTPHALALGAHNLCYPPPPPSTHARCCFVVPFCEWKRCCSTSAPCSLTRFAPTPPPYAHLTASSLSAAPAQHAHTVSRRRAQLPQTRCAMRPRVHLARPTTLERAGFRARKWSPPSFSAHVVSVPVAPTAPLPPLLPAPPLPPPRAQYTVKRMWFARLVLPPSPPVYELPSQF
jgi:hypothetical protein